MNQRTGLKENDLKFCFGKLRDQIEYHYNRKTGTFHNSLWLRFDRKPYRLLQYTTKNVVGCLDILNLRYSFTQNVHHIVEQVRSHNTNLYFEFLGDSRIRQQFLNFIRVSYINKYTSFLGCFTWVWMIYSYDKFLKV